MPDDVRILLLADSHLGFDLPVRPRLDRRRRGHDFLRNYAAALAPALAGEVDLVVHAGDVFDRSKVISTLAFQALDPLRRVADAGVPVFIVPGNHERSRLPHLRFASHPRIHVFDRPRTVTASVRGVRIALAGFPYERGDVRRRFGDLLAQTGWTGEPAALRLLCVHHCFEGATVGPADYTFTTAADVIRMRDVPAAFDVVLSGHIHRHQVLTRDLAGCPVRTPVLYPGSIERTALAEIGEPKGYMVVRAAPDSDRARVQWEFRELPARPMIREEVVADGLSATRLAASIDRIVRGCPADAVLSIRVRGSLSAAHWRGLRAARLRAPRTMNVDVIPADGFTPSERRAPDAPADPQLLLFQGR